MRELKLLLRVEFKHILSSLSLGGVGLSKAMKGSKGRGKSTVFTAVIGLSVVYLVFYAVLFSVVMAKAFRQVDAMYLLPALMMTASCLMMLFTTIYKVKGTIFGFNDYDLLMSLPVKTSTIVISRIVILYSLNFIFCAFLMLPAGAVYIYYALPDITFYIGFILSFFFIPFVPIIIAAVIGLLIHYVASFFKRKNIANLIITMSIFLGVMYLSFNAHNFISNVVDIGKAFMQTVNQYYPLAKMYTDGVCKSDFLSLFLFILISVSAFAVFTYVVGKKFKSLNTLMAANRTTSDYKMTTLKVTSPSMSLYKRELKRYFSSANYILNTGIGLLLFTMASVALIFMGTGKLETILGIPGAADIIAKAGPIAISLFVVLSCSTACAISLEGKSLWIIKSMPLSTKSIFLSKLAVNLTLSIPAILINASIFAFMFKFSFEQTMLMYLVPIAYAFFTAFGGLAINLNFPNFTWSNEITVIKQSAAVMLAVFIGMASVALPLVLMFTIHSLDAKIVTYATLIILAAADGLLYRYIMTKGVKIFSTF
jgi:ABC-2 type transport system permease protein